MNENDPQPIGRDLEKIVDDVVFTDPDTHPLRDEWERTKAEEEAAFARVCREEYEGRVMYHKICQTPNPEAEAWREVNLCKPVWQEVLDARLWERKQIILRKVSAVLEAKKDDE
jgi:hypothetical protein